MRAFPGPHAGRAGAHGARPARVVPRDARGRHRRGRRGHDGAAGPRPSARSRACPASRPTRGSATTASSPTRRRWATSRTRRRSSPPSRRPSRDGMDVDQLLRRRAADRPGERRADGGVANVAAAGVVPVISAGNDRDEFGLGSDGSPGTAPEAITVAAVSNNHVFPPALTLDSAGRPDALARSRSTAPARDRVPTAWEQRADARRHRHDHRHRRDARRPPALRAGRTIRTAADDPLPAGSLTGAIALVSRGVCTFTLEGRARAGGRRDRRGASWTTAPARRTAIPVELGRAGRDDRRPRRRAAPRRFMAGSGGRTTVTIGRDAEQIDTGRGGVVTCFSSGGPDGVRAPAQARRGAPGGQILSSTLPNAPAARSPSSTGRAWRRRT